MGPARSCALTLPHRLLSSDAHDGKSGSHLLVLAPFSQGPCLPQHTQQSALVGGEIRPRRGGDNREGLSLGLFRFSLVARLDTTSEWTKGATTQRLAQGLSPVFGLRMLGRRQKTPSALNNPLSQLLSLITKRREKTSPGNILCTADRNLGRVPATASRPVPRPSTYYLHARPGVQQHPRHREDEARGRRAARGDARSDPATHGADKAVTSGGYRGNAPPPEHLRHRRVAAGSCDCSWDLRLLRGATARAGCLFNK